MTLALRPLIKIVAAVSAPIDFGDPGGGVRRCIPITGGDFTGTIEGEVLAMAEAAGDGRIQKGQLVLLEGMGGGFTWGSALIRW